MKVEINDEEKNIKNLTIIETNFGYVIYIDFVYRNFDVITEREILNGKNILTLNIFPDFGNITMIPENEYENYAFNTFAIAYEHLSNAIAIYLINMWDSDSHKIVYDFLENN